MLEAATDRTRVVFLCTPNNPTGGLLSTEEVVRLARGLPKTTVLVVDEAYYEYGRHAGGEDHLAALAEVDAPWVRSEEHTSELQSLMRLSYAVFCLTKKTKIHL